MHQLTITPPLDAALVLGLPLAVLWHNNNRFYGSFDAALGYREEVEKIGTLSSLRGQLFVFDEECFFAVPNMLRRSGQFSVLCQFMMTSLCVKKSAVEPARIFIIAVSGKDSAGDSAVEYSLVFESPSDKAACQHTILMLQRTQCKPKEVGDDDGFKGRCWSVLQTP